MLSILRATAKGGRKLLDRRSAEWTEVRALVGWNIQCDDSEADIIQESTARHLKTKIWSVIWEVRVIRQRLL